MIRIFHGVSRNKTVEIVDLLNSIECCSIHLFASRTSQINAVNRIFLCQKWKKPLLHAFQFVY